MSDDLKNPPQLGYLRQWRLKRGMSLLQLGKKIGVSKTAVCHYESGYSRLSLDQTVRIIRALNIGLVDFFTLPDVLRPPIYAGGQPKETPMNELRETIETIIELDEPEALLRTLRDAVDRKKGERWHALAKVLGDAEIQLDQLLEAKPEDKPAVDAEAEKA